MKLFGIACIFVSTCILSTSSALAQTTCVSVGLNGTEANAPSSSSITSSGKFIAFSSSATNIADVPVRTNQTQDAYVFNRADGSYRVVNRNGSNQPLENGEGPSISRDGQVVAFSSTGDTLVSGDTNGVSDVFVRNLVDSTIRRVSVSSTGLEGNGASSIAFVSGDGRFVFFHSRASNLVDGDTNSVEDIFKHNLSNGQTIRVNLLPGEIQSSSTSSHLSGISLDGRWAVFEDSANSTLSVYLRDTELGTTVQVAAQGTTSSISGDGRFIAFENQVGSEFFFFRYDRESKSTVQVCPTRDPASAPFSENSFGYSPFSSLSDDGRYLAYSGIVTYDVGGVRTNAVDILVCDNEKVTLFRPLFGADGSRANGFPSRGVIAGDASRIVFTSSATNLVTSPVNSHAQVYSSELDLCANNPAKTLPGACGCNISDSDSNSNGAADCLDPSATLKPAKAVLSVRGKAVTVTMQSFPGSGISYLITISRVGKGNSSNIIKTSRKSGATISNLAAGKYRLSYVVRLGKIRSKASSLASFAVKTNSRS